MGKSEGMNHLKDLGVDGRIILNNPSGKNGGREID
jgi:hypothetical protein